MPSYTITNKLNQPLAIYYFDSNGDEQIKEAAALATISFIGDLHPNTLALLNARPPSIVLGIGQVVTPSPTIPPVVRTGLPLVWFGDWRSKAFYKRGSAVASNGKMFVSMVDHSGTTPPTITDPNWLLMSLTDANAFFDVDLGGAPDGSIVFYDGATWQVGLVEDINVGGISSSKISDLATVLGEYIRRDGTIAMTAPLVLSGNPASNLQAVPKQYADTKLPKSGGTITGQLTLANSPTAPGHAARKDYIDGLIGDRLPIAGGTMLGALILNGDPLEDLGAATKSYADTKLSKAGGSLTGALVLVGNPTETLEAATKGYVDTKLAKAGGTMTGDIVLSGNPTLALHATPKQYVDTMLPLAGGTLTGPLVLSGIPTENLNPVNLGYLNARMGELLSLDGGELDGSLILFGAPTEDLEAATKKYVDDNTTNKLPKAGGVMTGAITGAHGLLPIDGSNRMTGELKLLEQADGDTTSDGLYHSTDTSTPAYKGKTLCLIGPPVILTGDYTVVAGDSHIRANTENSSLNIFLDDTDGFPLSPVTITKEGFDKNRMVNIRTPDGDVISLSEHDESATYLPTAGGWIFLSRSRKPRPTFNVSIANVAAETSNAREVTIALRGMVPTTENIVGVTNPSGMLSFNIGSTTGWAVGDRFTVMETAAYNGDYTVTALTGSDLISLPLRVYTNSQSGILVGYKQPVLGSVIKKIAVAVSASPSNPWATTLSCGLSISLANPGRLYGLTGNGLGGTLMVPNDGAIVKVTDTTLAARTLWLHFLSAGEHNEIIGGIRETDILNVGHYSTNIVAAASHISGTLFTMTTGRVSGFGSGDTVVITGAGAYDGTHHVVSVDSGASQVVIDVAFSGSISSGTISNSNIIAITVLFSTGFEAGQVVQAEGATALGSYWAQYEVFGVESGVVSVRQNDYDVGGLPIGILRLKPVAKLTYT